MNIARLTAILLVSSVLAAGSAGAAEPAAGGDVDPLRAALLESKDKNRSVTIHAGGANVTMIVTSLDERYVVGRAQQASRVVFRLDRIDGVSALF